MSVEVKLNEEVKNRFNYIASKVKTELENDNKRKIFILVPDQFNFACQKLMFDMLDTKVISQVEVLSFNRLIYRIYEEVNYFKENISNIERLSLITNIVMDKKDELKFFGKYSITDKIIIEINNLMKLITKNVINVSDLKTFKDDNEVILTNKINDIAIIYEEYAKRMISMNCDIDVITPLSDVIKKCEMINNSSIFVSEFYNFTNEQIEILKILEKNDAKITLVMQATSDYDKSDKGIFAPIRNILEKMKISDANIEYLNMDSNKNSDLIEIKNIFINDEHRIEKDLKNVSVNAYSSKEKEIFNICLKIRDLIDKGYRYKDIVVAIRNYDSYELKIHNFFDAFNIPYYQENQKPLSNAKIVRTLLKMFDMINSNYNNDKIMSFLSEGMFYNIDDSDIYNYENFYLETGIEYFDTLEKKFEKVLKEVENKKENKEIKISTKCNVSKLKHAFDFINNIKKMFNFKISDELEVNLYNEIAIDVLTKIIKPEYIDAEDKETEKIVNVFDKWNMCEEKKLNLDDYIMKLNILIEDINVRRVDESIDMVYIFDSKRVNFLSSKILILAGYSNTILGQSKLTNLFSEKESEKLNSCNIEFNKKFKDQILEERFLFFNMIEKAEEELSINYTMFEDDAKVEISNELLKINEYNDKMNRIYYDDEYILDNLLCSDEAIIKFIYTKINEFEMNSGIIKKALSNIKDKDMLEDLFEYTKENNIQIEDDIEELNLSFSAIKKYMDCPFSYFMQYKLGVKERDEMKYDAAKVGNIAHEVFEKFFNKVAADELDCANMNDDDIKTNIDYILENEVDVDYLHDDKNDVTVTRYKDILYRNIINFVKQINGGEFHVRYNELEFGKEAGLRGIEFVSNDGVKVYLGGKIDRVDTIEDDNNIYLRVIDYKTGDDTFDVDKVLEGKGMQLVIYLKILLDKYKEENKKVTPAGIFLAKINKNFEREHEYNLSDNKLDGLINEDESIMAKMDKDFRNSSILNLKYKVNNELDSKSLKRISSTDNFAKLANDCVDVTKEYSEKIISGIMDVKTNKNEKGSNCEFCPYKNMCTINE